MFLLISLKLLSVGSNDADNNDADDDDDSDDGVVVDDIKFIAM